MYHVSAQGVDERMLNVHYYYYARARSPVHRHWTFFWAHLPLQPLSALYTPTGYRFHMPLEEWTKQKRQTESPCPSPSLCRWRLLVAQVTGGPDPRTSMRLAIRFTCCNNALSVGGMVSISSLIINIMYTFNSPIYYLSTEFTLDNILLLLVTFI